MQVALGRQTISVCMVEDQAEASEFLPEFVSGVLEGFASKGLFGLISAARSEQGGGKEVIEVESVVNSVPKGEAASTMPLQPVPEENSDSFGDSSYDDGFSPPAHQFRNLFPFHVLTDIQGHLIQVRCQYTALHHILHVYIMYYIMYYIMLSVRQI